MIGQLLSNEQQLKITNECEKNTKRSGHKCFLPWVTKATGFQFYETVHASLKHNYRQAKISVPAFHTQVLHSILFFFV